MCSCTVRNSASKVFEILRQIGGNFVTDVKMGFLEKWLDVRMAFLLEMVRRQNDIFVGKWSNVKMKFLLKMVRRQNGIFERNGQTSK